MSPAPEQGSDKIMLGSGNRYEISAWLIASKRGVTGKFNVLKNPDEKGNTAFLQCRTPEVALAEWEIIKQVLRELDQL